MNNLEIFKKSEKYMPGGVNSPVRAFSNASINPPIIKKGLGSRIVDEEGKEYIDFVASWGPMILGHNDPEVVEAIQNTVEDAISFGAPTELELKLAKHMVETLDNIDMVRMVNSGTEATMSAIKLARGYTRRDRIIKFAGCYHGHFDGFLVEAGSGVLTERIPGSPGVPKGSIENTLIAEYNHIDTVEALFEKYPEEIAAIIIEPIAGNMGTIPAKTEFLQRLREICTKYGALLIFDEVMTGFRVAYKGAQSRYGVKPDLTTYAKIMGGGLPSGAYGGRRDIMEKLSPIGPVYQAGTMSGNPVVMAAGYTTLKKLYDNPSYYDHMEKIGAELQKGIEIVAKEKGLPVVVNRCGAMLTPFFSKRDKVADYEDAKSSDTELYGRFFEHMIKSGIYIAPSQFEAMFIGVKHDIYEVERFLEAMRKF
ncbi:glutamate-1-semialdehyde 2,1-aminomutase [Clostridium tetani]|uniref:glutamate-1-semialdehyde 2,1-aminomutase n=1 Tax=Clostridium tetani TaxID=1513 RepID=UPI0029532084|nr:glutamate-1-semialdehyde 2,1-aminomutase [Clostridium tetani]BDR69134.1 glutamate-1-semialdehyde 2,1-aminomutase [Clostridium tetani]BEV18691.1 glutamate-1-semialdehyde 2,1-aminomutase [Clostridium tetani]